MREHRPVYWHEPVNQWFVFPYDDVASLFGDPRLSANRVAGFVDAVPEKVRDDVRALLPTLERWLIFRDGDEHTQLKATLRSGFNAKAIEAMRGSIERTANQLLDQAASSGVLDVGADYGYLLPVYVLSDFMGVPPEGRDRIVQWSADFVDFFNVIPITVDTTQRMVSSATEMLEYMRELLRGRRPGSDDDFLGLMSAACAAGEITEDEIVGNTVLMLIAGHVAVRNLIGNVVWLLLEHPSDYKPGPRRSFAAQTRDRGVASIRTADHPDPAYPYGGHRGAGSEDRGGRDHPALDRCRQPRPATVPGPRSFRHHAQTAGPAQLQPRTAWLPRRAPRAEQTTVALEVLFRRAGDTLRLDDRSKIRWYRNAGNRGPENLPVRFG